MAQEPSTLADSATATDAPEALLSEAERLVYDGQAMRAIALAERCWALIEFTENLRLQAHCQRLLGLAHERRGAPDDALRAVYRSLALYEKLGDRHGQARTLSLVAVQLAVIGGSAQAFDHLERAVTIAAELRDPDTDFRVWNNLSVIYDRLEDYPKAIAATHTALDNARLLGNEHMLKHAETALVISRIRQSLHTIEAQDAPENRALLAGILAEARLHCEACRALGFDVMVTTTTQAMGDGFLALGRTDEARAALEDGLSIAVTLGQRGEECDFELKLGMVQCAASEFQQGMVRLRRALAIAEDLGRRDLRVNCHKRLSKALQDQGELAGALEHYQQFHELQVSIMRANASAHVQVMSLKLDIERTRLEAEILRLRATELERDNRNLQNHAQQLSREALEDPLTGLGNRRFFEQQVSALRSASGATLTLAIGDIDHFKRVNDNFSHAVGDDVLREVGALFRRCFRPQDVVARFGGEEFVVAILGSTPEQAARAAERLRGAIEAHDWPALKPGLAVTISVGLANLGSGEAIDAVLARADAALYVAKRGGRNRVAASPEDPGR
jgi:diguanylate cyclase (GGDEF)-like protein